MKKCFDCQRTYPLFMFSKSRMKYQRPNDYGVVKVCRICNYKKWSKDMSAWLYDFSIRKFQLVKFKSKWEILKSVLK